MEKTKIPARSNMKISAKAAPYSRMEYDPDATKSEIVASYTKTGDKYSVYLTLTGKALLHIKQDHSDSVKTLKTTLPDFKNDRELIEALFMIALTGYKKYFADLNALEIGDSMGITIRVDPKYQGRNIFGQKVEYFKIVLKKQANKEFSICSAFPKEYPSKSRIIRDALRRRSD